MSTGEALHDCILGLDFDGVLWDSVGECLLCTRETLVREYGKSAPSDAVAEAFRRGRWLVRTGGDFLLVYELASSDPERDFEAFSKADFQALREIHRERLAAFETRFYAMRRRLREEETESWLHSQQPYSAVVAQFPLLRQAFREVVLITTKDAPSAHMLLKSAAIELPIWSRENGVDKGEQVLDLCRKRQHQPDRVILIDDLLENLEQVARVGARGCLANWGYNTTAERAASQQQGYTVLNSTNLLAQLGVRPGDHGRGMGRQD